MHSLDTLLEAAGSVKSIEATAMFASLSAAQRPGQSSSDLANSKVKARELYDKVCKALHLPEAAGLMANGHAKFLTRSQRKLADDIEMHLEIAKLWHDDDHGRVERGLQEAFRLSEAAGKVDPRLVNNLGTLQHIAGRFDTARPLYERALTDATLSSIVSEHSSTSILYNLARLYEDQSEDSLAKDAYDKLLARHPEYVDGTFCIRLIYCGY